MQGSALDMVDVYIPKKGINKKLEPEEIRLQSLPDNIEVLHLMENELAEQIKNLGKCLLVIFQFLERSNDEMMEFDPSGDDQDLTDACLENAYIIQEKLKTLESVKKKINNTGCTCAKHSAGGYDLTHLQEHNRQAGVVHPSDVTQANSLAINDDEEAVENLPSMEQMMQEGMDL